MNYLKKNKTMNEKFLIPQSPAVHRSLETERSDNAYWLRGVENPADGVTKVTSDIVPLPRLPESGAYYPGILRPLRGISASEGGRKFALFCFP